MGYSADLMNAANGHHHHTIPRRALLYTEMVEEEGSEMAAVRSCERPET
jgi:hypothetical protein